MFHMVQPEAIEFCDMVIIKGIIDLPSIFASAYQPLLPQSAQLMGYRGFSHLKLRGDITNVHFAFEQNGDDPQAGRVAQGTEEVSQVGGGMFL
jgi:hypothetical protein